MFRGNQKRKEAKIMELNAIAMDEAMLFDRWPQVLPLYIALREKLTAAYPDMTVKATKTQVSFRNRHVFAMASPPWRRAKAASS